MGVSEFDLSIIIERVSISPLFEKIFHLLQIKFTAYVPEIILECANWIIQPFCMRAATMLARQETEQKLL